jgi:hypothetical protein
MLETSLGLQNCHVDKFKQFIYPLLLVLKIKEPNGVIFEMPKVSAVHCCVLQLTSQLLLCYAPFHNLLSAKAITQAVT